MVKTKTIEQIEEKEIMDKVSENYNIYGIIGGFDFCGYNKWGDCYDNYDPYLDEYTYEYSIYLVKEVIEESGYNDPKKWYVVNKYNFVIAIYDPKSKVLTMVA